LSVIESSIYTIAGRMASFATSFREASQDTVASSLHLPSETSTASLHTARRYPANRGFTQSTPIEHAVLVLNKIFENTAIRIKKYSEALNILNEDQVKV